MSTTFSIIVPVYNVKDYLVDCVASVISQNYDDIELLLIDDGSTDGSGELCDKLEKENEKIKVIHKKNGGSADARNKGIECSSGEYLLFLDSDDFWENECFLFKLDKIAKEKKPDLIRFGVRQIDSKTCRVLTQSNITGWERYNSLTNPYPQIVRNGHLTISACLHAIKRSFLIQNGILFKPGLLCEDIEWGIRLFAQSPSIYFFPINIYNYRYRRQGSHTANTDKKTLYDYCAILENGFGLVGGNDSLNWLSEYLMYQTTIAIAHTNFQNINCEDRKELNIRFKILFEQNAYKYKSLKKTKLAYFIYKLFGYNLMAKFLGWYLGMRGR